MTTSLPAPNKESEPEIKNHFLFQALPTKTFIISQLLILLAGLLFLFGLNFYLKKDLPKVTWSNLSPVTSTPKEHTLEVNLEDGVVVFEKSLLVSGKTNPRSTVLISAASDYGFNSGSSGDFSRIVDLDPGINELTIFSFDQNGRSKEVKRMVYFSEEKL